MMDILVVDDNKEICTLIENILLSEGYAAESCSNPLEYREKLQRGLPRLIITDLLMSGFDGRTLTNEIKAAAETAHIRIMLMSAHPDAAHISENIGVDAFLTKPFEIDELISRVQLLMA